jgi:hypothetical protein
MPLQGWQVPVLVTGSLITGLSMLLKTAFLYVHMWQRGTRDKTAIRFLVFELFVVVFWWLFYENEEMSRTAVIFQRVITIGMYVGTLMVLVALWKDLF